MNKSIKYLGFSFLGGLLLFTLGALRPFIASENGLAFGLTASNAVMVGSFRSMSGAVTNICADFSTPQHVRIMPQTANTGEFDIGDPAQATGRYLMFSKLAGTFLLGHDGTDAFRVNVANGYVTMPGGSLFGDGTGGIFELNANAQFEVDPLGQLFLNGDDTVASHRSEIFLHGTNAHIRLDLGAPIEDWTAVTHLTMAPGSASLDGALKVSGTGGSVISQSASNGLGSVHLRPDFTMANTQTVVWPTNLPAVGQHLGVKATNWYGTTNLEIQTDWETASGSQTPWTSDINGAGFSLSNAFKLSLGTNGYSGTQNPSFILGGTNSAGTGTMFKMANTNGQLEVRSGSNTTFSASLPMSLTAAGAMTLNQGLTVGNSASIVSSAGFLSIGANSANVYLDNGAGLAGVQSAAPSKFFVATNAEYSFYDGSSAVTAALRSQVAGTVELNSGTYGVYRDLILRTLTATNVILNASIAAPAAPANAGALVWTDGTNLCAVFKNAGGTLTTNKFTMSAWP